MVPTAETLVGPQRRSAEDVQDIKIVATPERIRVAIIEDDERVRQALVFQLNTAGFQVVSCPSAHEFLTTKDASSFDCVVVDIYLPKMNGLQLQEELRETGSFVSIVFITGHGDLSIGVHAMRNGAVDFLEKPVNDEALLNSISRGADLSRRLRAERVRRVELEKRHGSLTSREREVFSLITTGLLNKQAGAELGTTERTVKAHRARVMSKMGAGSLADLVRIAEVLQIHPTRTQSGQMR